MSDKGKKPEKTRCRPIKEQLPQKICVVCGRPFTWRKKWERDWEFVKYDFYYQPEIMAQVVEYTASVPPVDGVKEELAKLGSPLADSPMLFPSEEDAKRIYDFRQLTPAETKKYIEAFVSVINA